MTIFRLFSPDARRKSPFLDAVIACSTGTAQWHYFAASMLKYISMERNRMVTDFRYGSSRLPDNIWDQCGGSFILSGNIAGFRCFCDRQLHKGNLLTGAIFSWAASFSTDFCAVFSGSK